MAIPLEWNTLEQAAKWLSHKTNDGWTAKKVIEFSIDRCNPDDIVEDYKYPTYLRALIPETMASLLTSVALRDTYSSPSDIDYVCRDVSFGGKKASITFLFKENLIALMEGGESTLLYVSFDDYNLVKKDAATVTIYCELQPLIWFLDDPLMFPKLPVIEINYESVGIRDEELRQLLRDYLSLPKQVRDKAKIENVYIGETDYLKIKERIYPVDELIEEAIAKAGSCSINPVFLELKAFAEQENPPPPLTGGCGANYIEYEKSSGEKADLTKQALGRKLERRRRKLEEIEQKNGR